MIAVARSHAADVPSTRRYETLGTYRFALALFVFYGHLTFLVITHEPSKALYLQNVGVSLFFVVSGYVIFSGHDKFYRGRPLSYLKNRLLRIYPPFWIVYLATIGPLLVSGHSEMQDYSLKDILSDLTLMGGYLQISPLQPMQQSWSLIQEVLFYLAAFAYFVIADLLMRQRHRRLCEFLFYVATIGLYLFVYYSGSYNRWFGGGQWAPMFGLGIAVYHLRRDGMRNLLALSATMVLALLALHQFHARYIVHIEANMSSFYIFTAMLLGFFWLVSPHGPRLPRRIDKTLGNLTYMLFLLHYPVMKMFEETKWFGSFWDVTVATLTIAVGTVAFYYLLEAPIDRLRDRVRGYDLT